MNAKTSNPDELAHRLQLAKWCAMHKMPVPVGPVVDAFVAAMGSTHHYGVEETWDAFVWFRQGWEMQVHMGSALVKRLRERADAYNVGDSLRALLDEAADALENPSKVVGTNPA